MKINDLIVDGQNGNFIKNMLDPISILADYVFPQGIIISEVQNRYIVILECYVSAFSFYIKEVANSFNSIDFLGINAIGRSALECYSLAKFIYLNFNSDTNKLFQLLIASDLMEIKTLIDKYKEQSKNTPELSSQINTYEKLLSEELNIFPNAKIIYDNSNNEKNNIIKEIKNVLKENDFAKDICNSDGFISISKLVSKMLETNDYFKIIFGNEIESKVFYDLMCSFTHNNYNSIMKLFDNPDGTGYKVSLYPQHDEQYNKNSILKMLYANFVDLINCLDEVIKSIQSINSGSANSIHTSKKYIE